jgi:hypothetical protein
MDRKIGLLPRRPRRLIHSGLLVTGLVGGRGLLGNGLGCRGITERTGCGWLGFRDVDGGEVIGRFSRLLIRRQTLGFLVGNCLVFTAAGQVIWWYDCIDAISIRSLAQPCGQLIGFVFTRVCRLRHGRLDGRCLGRRSWAGRWR